MRGTFPHQLPRALNKHGVNAWLEPREADKFNIMLFWTADFQLRRGNVPTRKVRGH
jgi:hypothetical protein